MSFNTAIMQVTARETGQPLDSMTTETHFTTMTRPETVGEYPEGGRFIHGLFLEGARWLTGDDCEEDTFAVTGVTCQGHLTASRLKELMCPLPIM